MVKITTNCLKEEIEILYPIKNDCFYRFVAVSSRFNYLQPYSKPIPRKKQRWLKTMLKSLLKVS